MSYVSIATMRFHPEGVEYYDRRVWRRSYEKNPHWWVLTIGDDVDDRFVIRGGAIFRASSTDPEDPSVLKAVEWYMFKNWLFLGMVTENTLWKTARFTKNNPDEPILQDTAIAAVERNVALLMAPVAGTA